MVAARIGGLYWSGCYLLGAGLEGWAAMKNQAAVELVKLRWKKMGPEARSQWMKLVRAGGRITKRPQKKI